MLINCRECLREISSEAKTCPNCGYANTHIISDRAKAFAIASLVLGILAMLVPVAYIDVIMGIVGICLAVSAKKEGYKRGLQKAGFVCSIIGTILAVNFTLMTMFGVI